MGPKNPQYDDPAHIDSSAIDHPKKPVPDYTADYLKPLKKDK